MERQLVWDGKHWVRTGPQRPQPRRKHAPSTNRRKIQSYAAQGWLLAKE